MNLQNIQRIIKLCNQHIMLAKFDLEATLVVNNSNSRNIISMRNAKSCLLALSLNILLLVGFRQCNKMFHDVIYIGHPCMCSSHSIIITILISFFFYIVKAYHNIIYSFHCQLEQIVRTRHASSNDHTN